MKYDVIIIGAGAAGLMAAYELTRKNKSVLVLEALDRIGGRICTIPPGVFSWSVEAGAEFIHGEAAFTDKLLKKARITSREMNGEMYQLERGELIQQNFFDNEWKVMIDELAKVRYDMPFYEFLDQRFPRDNYPEFFEGIRRFVEGYNAANMKDVSTMALKEEWTQEEEPKQYRAIGGYGELIAYMHEQILLQHGVFALRHRVHEIQWKQNSVYVKTDQLDFESSRVLITIPVSLIQNNNIRFSPALPEHEKAAAGFGFGSVIKFLIEFKDMYWETKAPRKYSDLKFIFSDAPIPTWWSQQPEKRSLLTGWLGGPKAKEIQQDKDYLFEQALISLAYIFNDSVENIKTQIHAWHIENWHENPYSLGAYSYPKIETEHAKQTFNIPVENTLFFAGEALHLGPASGTVEAAFASGHDTALKILKTV